MAVCPGHTEEEIQGVAERIEQIANAEVLFGLSETSAGGMTQASRNVIDAREFRRENPPGVLGVSPANVLLLYGE